MSYSEATWVPSIWYNAIIHIEAGIDVGPVLSADPGSVRH